LSEKVKDMTVDTTDDPERLNDPWANKLWETVDNFRAALNGCTVGQGTEALAIIIADTMAGADDPYDVLEELSDRAIDLFEAIHADDDGDDLGSMRTLGSA